MNVLAELEDLGLKIETLDLKDKYPKNLLRGGSVSIANGKLFISIIPPVSESGYIDWLVASLYGQNENSAVKILSRFAGYSPSFRYRSKKAEEAGKGLQFMGKGEYDVTYEWRRTDSNEKIQELANDADIYDLIPLEDVLKVHRPITDMSTVYQEFTPDMIALWEQQLRDNPDAEWNCNKVSELLPFLKATMPRVGMNQSLFGLSMISLDRRYPDEVDIVLYGLAPLTKAGILNREEACQIVDWYRWAITKRNNHKRFQKVFEIGDQKYQLISEYCKGCRDLNLQVIRE